MSQGENPLLNQNVTIITQYKLIYEFYTAKEHLSVTSKRNIDLVNIFRGIIQFKIFSSSCFVVYEASKKS